MLNATFGFALGLDSTGSEYGERIATDGTNVYVAGAFDGTVDFDPGPGVSSPTSPAAGRDGFVAKYSSTGDFLWSGQFKGPATVRAIAVDSSGVYATGVFAGSVDFNLASGEVLTLTSRASGGYDTYVCKFDSSGDFLWATQFGLPSDPGSGGIAVDSSGVYVTGTSSGVFVSKLDPVEGSFLWKKQLGGTGNDQGQSIAVDHLGNVYTTGQFTGTSDFDPGARVFDLQSAGDEQEIFVSKLDNSGNFVWAKQLGGPKGDVGMDLAVDGAGNVYTTGYFTGTADFDPGPGTFELTSHSGTMFREDVFISKLDTNGDLLWAKAVGGPWIEIGYSIAVDESGNVYTTGMFNETIDFDPGAGTFFLSGRGGYLLKLDSAGNFVSADKVAEGIALAGNIAVDSSGVYTTGHFVGTVDFDPGTDTHNLTSSPNSLGALPNADIFISKLFFAPIAPAMIDSPLTVTANVDSVAANNEDATATSADTLSVPIAPRAIMPNEGAGTLNVPFILAVSLRAIMPDDGAGNILTQQNAQQAAASGSEMELQEPDAKEIRLPPEDTSSKQKSLRAMWLSVADIWGADLMVDDVFQPCGLRQE